MRCVCVLVCDVCAFGVRCVCDVCAMCVRCVCVRCAMCVRSGVKGYAEALKNVLEGLRA